MTWQPRWTPLLPEQKRGCDIAEQHTVTISPRASRQLIAHVEFLSRKSIHAAPRLSAGYKAVIQTLKTNLFQFPVDPNSDPENPHRIALFTKRYQLYFDVDALCVYVGAVRDCRQDPNRH